MKINPCDKRQISGCHRVGEKRLGRRGGRNFKDTRNFGDDGYIDYLDSSYGFTCVTYVKMYPWNILSQ